MESWFLADPECLARYFKERFSPKALPGKPTEIEKVPKADVMKGLKRATRGEYDEGTKGKHSFAILAELDPEKVCAASRYARAFREALRKRLTRSDSSVRPPSGRSSSDS